MSEVKTIAQLRDAVISVGQYAGCGDSGCRFVRPKGMSTNGGCRCLGRGGDAKPGLASSLARLYKAALAVTGEESP